MSSRKLLAVLGISALAASHQVSAIPMVDFGNFSVTVEDETILSTQQTGVEEETFTDGETSLYTNISGDFSIIGSDNKSGKSAVPLGIDIDTSRYLSVPINERTGAATLELDASYGYFGLYWGSIDKGNSIEFFKDGDLVASLLGGQLPDITAWRSQDDYNGNRFVNVDFDEGFSFNSLKFSSDGYAFETDNHAFGNKVPVPEPGTLGLLGLGLAGLFCVRRNRTR